MTSLYLNKILDLRLFYQESIEKQDQDPPQSSECLLSTVVSADSIFFKLTNI